MRTLYIRPCPLLQPYIHHFAYTDIEQDGTNFQLDLHPTGYTSLTYILGNSAIETSDLTGQRIFNRKFSFNGQLKKFTPIGSGPYSAICVVFKPFGATHFFSHPQYDFTDRFTELDDILLGNSINQQLLDCNEHPLLAIAVLEEWLQQLLEKRKALSPKSSAAMPRLSAILKKMTINKGRTAIEDISRDFNIPARTLEMQFNNHIGISPKLFSRMLRINHAHKQCIIQRKTDWQEIIHECNYFDQAHFIKEFKTFFGHTPAGTPPGRWNLSAALLGYAEKKPEPYLASLA